MSRKRLTNLILILGVAMVLISSAMLVFSEISEKINADEADRVINSLLELMPEIHSAAPDDRVNVQMPAVEISGESYIGVLELIKYDCKLPVRAKWNKQNIAKSPSVYTGSIYDRTLVIGGSDGEGQFDFMKLITNGDVLLLTDMTGARFSYEVTDVRKTKDVSAENLTDAASDLTIFAKNTYSLDYTVVRLKLK